MKYEIIWVIWNDKLIVHNSQFLRNGYLKEIRCSRNDFEKYYYKYCQRLSIRAGFVGATPQLWGLKKCLSQVGSIFEIE